MTTRNIPLCLLHRESELAQVRQENVKVAKRDMKRLLIILLAIGLGIGAVVAVGVVFVLDRADLTDPRQEKQLID